jgi:hypothetical protein
MNRNPAVDFSLDATVLRVFHCKNAGMHFG